MFFSTKIEDCCETVIAAMAYQIEHLQYELQFKQSRIDALERENEELRVKQEGKTFDGALARDLDKDPFDGGNV